MIRRRMFFEEEDGVTAIEYGLIIGLIALLIIASTQLIGMTLNGFFVEAGTTMETAGD